jgi:hypothetical protein
VNSDAAPLLDVTFAATLIEWRGPAPFVFAPLPDDLYGEVRFAARAASYGWGVVPVSAEIAGCAFTTSLFPRGATYLLPIKKAVQKACTVAPGDRVDVAMRVMGR